jgi:hypothetical protein
MNLRPTWEDPVFVFGRHCFQKPKTKKLVLTIMKLETHPLDSGYTLLTQPLKLLFNIWRNYI